MKYITILLLLLYTHFTFGQTVDFNKIKFNGLNFYSTKSEIIKKFGKPKKVFNPNYECGFLSGDGQSVFYFTLDYGRTKFTGNKTDKYVLEKINFENDDSIVLNYKQYKLTCKTTFKELTEIFGKKIIKLIGKDLNGSFTIMHKNNDDGIVLEVKKGKLTSVTYWSPC